MLIFHRMVVPRSPAPMTCLSKILVFQCHDAPFFRVTNLVGVKAITVPVFSKRPAILARVSFELSGELLKTGWQRVTGVFLVEHGRHVVGATGVSGGVVDGHGSGHGHIDWCGNGDR